MPLPASPPLCCASTNTETSCKPVSIVSHEAGSVHSDPSLQIPNRPPSRFTEDRGIRASGQRYPNSGHHQPACRGLAPSLSAGTSPSYQYGQMELEDRRFVAEAGQNWPVVRERCGGLGLGLG